MPLEIWNHLFHPFTHRAVDGKQQDFSPDDISRVKQIASGSIVVGALEAYSSSRSVKFSIITIGLATLAIFYIAAAIFKMRNRENPDPKQPCPPIPEKQKEPIPSEQGLPPQSVPSPHPVVSSGPASSSSIDSASLETHGTKVAKEEPRKADLTSTGKSIEKEEKKLRAQQLPASEPQSPAPRTPQLAARDETPRIDTGEQGQKKLDKQNPSATASPQLPAPKQKLYCDLPITDEEGKIIHEIIQTIGSISLWMIPAKTPRLIELGDKIQHVHPLKFLEKVLNTPELKASMIKVEDSTLKWKGFLWGNKIDGSAGFEAKCNRETEQNNFAIYIVDFCKAVNAPIDKVRPFVAKKDWAGFVRFLLKLK